MLVKLTKKHYIDPTQVVGLYYEPQSMTAEYTVIQLVGGHKITLSGYKAQDIISKLGISVVDKSV